MSPVFNDPKAVAETAISYELEGRKILEDAKEKSKDALSKSTFEFLAGQELKHIEAIKSHFSALSEGKSFDQELIAYPVSKLQLREGIKGIFAKFKPMFEATAGTSDERQEIYGVAMAMERRGHDFYEEAAEKSTDTSSRKLYEFLRDEEIKHFQMIQETAAFLEQPDAIMAVEERWMQF